MAVLNKLSQSYGVSLAIWVSVTCRLTQVNTPSALTPARQACVSEVAFNLPCDLNSAKFSGTEVVLHF